MASKKEENNRVFENVYGHRECHETLEAGKTINSLVLNGMNNGYGNHAVLGMPVILQ